MRYTNELGLPEPLVEALKYDDYTAGNSDYTPTSLIAPPYQAKQKRELDDQIVKDVAENFFILEGKAMHKILEMGAQNLDNVLPEKRMYTQVKKWRIGMQPDTLWLDSGTLDDYKNCTCYKFKKDFDGNLPPVPDWETQLNIGAYILRQGGEVEINPGEFVPFQPFAATKLRIWGLLKDFSKGQIRKQQGYPRYPIQCREIPMWADERVEAYIIERAEAHDHARETSLEVLAACSEAETWARPTKYALMKEGRKSAVKLYESNEEAEAACKDPKHYVEVRPGERPRCQDYCDCSSFCPAYNQWKKENE
jgi:hypothetical protein